jgi:hypothetical protein
VPGDGVGPGRVGRAVRVTALVLLAVAVVAVMVRLSLWQWGRARERGALLNYSYAAEWLLFAVLTTVGVVHLWREGRRGESRERPPERRPDGPLVGPPLAPGEELEEVTWVRLRRRVGLDRSRS